MRLCPAGPRRAPIASGDTCVFAFAPKGVCFALKFFATMFAVGMLLTGPATMATPQCQATTDYSYWVDGYHCVDGTQSNCSQTHKCFSGDGSMADCYNYTTISLAELASGRGFPRQIWRKPRRFLLGING